MGKHITMDKHISTVRAHESVHCFGIRSLLRDLFRAAGSPCLMRGALSQSLWNETAG